MITNISTVPLMRTVLISGLVSAVALSGLSGCVDDATTDGDGPVVVVTTSILGDVVAELVGEAASVEVLMPPGTDPHDFAPSARQAADLRSADAVVVNGLGFEAGLAGVIEAAADDGVTVVTATDAIEPLPFDAPSGHGQEEEGEHEGDEGADPHFFTDPARMRQAAEHLADALSAAVPELRTPATRDRISSYLAELDDLDAEVEARLADVPAERRLLVTNHEVFGYFADRYGFEVVGAIIPGGSTLAEPSAADLAELVPVIEARGVPAVFADTSSPNRLARALADEGVDVRVVELYSESWGEAGSGADTYLGMVRTNVDRIAGALR